MKAHNDHPLAMFDRTCPGCDEETQMTKIPPWEASLNRAIDALDDVIENVPERSVTRIKGAIVWIEQAIHEAKSLSPKGAAPSILFDGYAVYQELPQDVRGWTSAENVSVVLDAVVRILRRSKPQPSLRSRRKCEDRTTLLQGVGRRRRLLWHKP